MRVAVGPSGRGPKSGGEALGMADDVGRGQTQARTPAHVEVATGEMPD
jgi:hypothetical protein